MHFDQAIIHLSNSLNFMFIKCLQITSFVNVLEVPTQNVRLQKLAVLLINVTNFQFLFTFNYVVSVWGGFLFLWVLGMGYVILLWYFLSPPYHYFSKSLRFPLIRNRERALMVLNAWSFRVEICK